MSFLEYVFHATEEENRKVILRLLEPAASARLLDLGCHNGELTRRWAARIGTSDVTGVELVPEMIERSRAACIKVVAADLNQRLPLPDASFDVIVANQVIEHLSNTDQFVAEVARLLAAGGYAVISTNNLSSLHNIVSLMLGQQPPPAHVSGEVILGNRFNPLNGQRHETPAMAHLRLFSHRALRELLLHKGLRCDLCERVGFYPAPPPLARVFSRAFPVYAAFLTCKVRRSVD
jgi:SAM-dependent methyltransferase